jgi:hypothetical protein
MPIRLLLLVLGVLCTAERAQAQFRVADPAPGENFHVELGLMFWTPTPELTIQTGALAALGAPGVDFVQEFGIEKTRFKEFRAVLKLARKHKLRVSQVPMEYDAAATLQRSISFGGIVIPVNFPATTHVSWTLWRFGYEYDFVAGDRGFVGLLTELKRNTVTAEIGTPGLGSEVAEVTAPVPTVGVVLRAYPHRNFSFTTEFTGFKVPGFIGNRITDTLDNDFEAKMFDMDIYGTVNFGGHVGVQFGYRSVTAEYAVDADAGDLAMKGTYFGGLVRF